MLLPHTIQTLQQGDVELRNRMRIVQNDNDQAQRRLRQLEDVMGDLRDIMDMQEDKVCSQGTCGMGHQGSKDAVELRMPQKSALVCIGCHILARSVFGLMQLFVSQTVPQLEVATQRMQAFIERKPANPLARLLWALLTLFLAGTWLCIEASQRF